MGFKNRRTGADFVRGPRRNKFADHPLLPPKAEPVVEREEVVELPPCSLEEPEVENLPSWVEPPEPEQVLPDWVEAPETPLPNAKGIEPLVQVKDLNPLPAKKQKPKK